jgi:hypothetical protein
LKQMRSLYMADASSLSDTLTLLIVIITVPNLAQKGRGYDGTFCRLYTSEIRIFRAIA